MKATELRIGNWVIHRSYFDDGHHGHYGGEHRRQVKMSLYLFNEIDNIEPIPLTEEWLEAFGFSLEGSEAGEDGCVELGAPNGGSKWYILICPKPGKYVKSKGMWIQYNYHESMTIPIPKYVHQLQNLYFALTGEELEKK